MLCACWYNNVEVVTILVSAILVSAPGINIDARERGGWTPLHIACWYNRVEIVPDVVRAGADANVRYRRGRTPLHVLCIEHGRGGVDECTSPRHRVAFVILWHARHDIFFYVQFFTVIHVFVFFGGGQNLEIFDPVKTPDILEIYMRPDRVRPLWRTLTGRAELRLA